MNPPSWTSRSALAVKAVVALLFAVALLLPNTAAAGVSLAALVALAGGYFPANAWRRLQARASQYLHGLRGDLLLSGLLTAAGALQMGGAWTRSAYSQYDWGPHHALLSHLVDALRDGQVPHWVQGVSTGDSPYELYGLLPYYLAAKLSLWFGAEDLALVLSRCAIGTHILAAVTAGLLARRLVPGPWALALGLAALFEAGSVWGGGPLGMFEMGVFHSTLANALWPLALIAVLRCLRQPSYGSAAMVWLSTAFVAACHPLGLVCALATLAGLGLVALLADEVSPRRAAAAGVHLCLGVALVAFVWMPFGSRLMLHGVQYPAGGRVSWQLLEQILQSPIPEGSAAPLVYAGYLGAVAGLVSRRAAAILIAGFSGVLLVGLVDQTYTLFDLLPSLSGSRMQTVRLASVARVGLFVLAADLVYRAFARRGRSSGPDDKSLGSRPSEPWGAWSARGAITALLLATALRTAVPYYEQHAAALRASVHRSIPDPKGFEQLIAWAQAQNEQMTPSTWGRLLHEDPRRSFGVYHLNARSRLPALRVGYVPMLFLRDRIEDTSAASLKRFNVRWVVKHGGSPSLGDPKSEQRFGQYVVRELPAWDGQFARVERGAGQVTTTVLDDERIEVTLHGTDRPSLVALGMGYYPRWRAEHVTEGSLPVYAIPTKPNGSLHIPAAWLPPGRTVFHADGALPSDGQGVALSCAALLLALGLTAASRWPTAVWPARRWLQHRGAWLAQRRVPLGQAGLVAVVCLMGAWGVLAASRPARALQLGNELWPSATVQFKAFGRAWRPCRYNPIHGGYRCPGGVLVQDSVDNLLNNAAPSHRFASPVVRVAARARGGQIRIEQRVKLAGVYWGATNGGRANLQVGEQPARRIDGKQRQWQWPDTTGTEPMVLQATVRDRSQLTITLVRKDSLEPERRYPSPPKTSPF